MSERGHAVDSGRPILLWQPDPTCDHENNDDCEHFAIWVGTRVASDTLERGTIVLDLREFNVETDGDGDDDVVIAQGIVVTCNLETGAVEELGREGGLFLQHHPWLVDSFREELGFFRRRAARAAAQRDRETAAKAALAVPARTMIPYHELFPYDWDLLPVHDGERYWAVDLYCRNPECTCASSVIKFFEFGEAQPKPVGEVVVDYAERDIQVGPSNDIVETIFDELWDDYEYRLRARHAEAHYAIRRFAQRATLTTGTPAPERVSRNDVCPCGSGKKFKRCCLNARPTRPVS